MGERRGARRPAVLLVVVVLLAGLIGGRAAAGSQGPVVIGLDADMSSGAAASGEALRRGALTAIAEINLAGGVLGRRLALQVRDHRGNPARGRDNIRELAANPAVVAVLGGIHTPVALHELAEIHARRIVYLGPWAAGTAVVDNGYDPNYVFRVSVRDADAGPVLVAHARRAGLRRPGLLLERTGWGRSNETALRAALAEQGLDLADVQWFHWGADDLSEAIGRLVAARADGVLLVANPREGAAAVRAMAALPPAARLPIISHWGITGGAFFDPLRDLLPQVDLVFLQSYSFFAPHDPARQERFFARYRALFPDVAEPGDIAAPAGTAHAYDMVHLLGRAIAKAGSTDRAAVRDAMENLGRYEGLVRIYDPPFTVTRHDALSPGDYRMARFDAAGRIVPVMRP